MARTKLTKEQRALARDALVQHAVFNRFDAMWTEQAALFNEVYKIAVPPEHVAIMATLPECWRSVASCLTVNASGWRIHLTNYGDRNRILNVWESPIPRHRGVVNVRAQCPEISVIVPKNMNYGEVPENTVLSPDLVHRLQKHASTFEELAETTRNLFTKITSTMASFVYLESLLEEVPELATLEPKLLEKRVSTALAPQAKGIMCEIAALRGEAREGCQDIAEAA